MSDILDRVRQIVTTTGTGSSIVVDTTADGPNFYTMQQAGAVDGKKYDILITDGDDVELHQQQEWDESTRAFTRGVPYSSIVGGVVGTNKIDLSGTARLRIFRSARSMDKLRGTRPVTGTSDTLNNSDQGYVVTYSNASAVAVTIGQAGASGLFLDGWATFVKNKNVGPVTITPATSTIDGEAALILQQNQGAFIWSDGTNYDVLILRGDIGVPVRADAAQSLTTGQKLQARLNIDAAPAITSLSNCITSDVALNNTSAYFTGPTIAQGTAGTWFVSCCVTITAPTTDNMYVRLWDGTTTIASSFVSIPAAGGFAIAVSLSGIITSPAGNLRVSIRDTTSVNGNLIANLTGLGNKDSSISAFRIA